MMKCPKCESSFYKKNGHRSGKQNYFCKNCGRQFLAEISCQNLHIENNSTKEHTETSPEVELTKTTYNATPEDLLKLVISNNWLESPAFTQFIQKVLQTAPSQAKFSRKIAILLLDAENLKLDSNIEKFLTSLCKYPLQVKIAFANWKTPSMGKQDTELYERGYQLVHVPGGKDSADAKMIALGASILKPYPTVKEVFVCSGDTILTHLCNQLQNQGLTVYWVRRQNQTLKVENRNTGDINYYSIALATEIPSFDDVIKKMEELINTEQASINQRLNNLSALANLFQERRNLTNQENPLNKSLELPPPQENNASTTQDSHPCLITIDSANNLEKVLSDLINQIKMENKQEFACVNKLRTRFHTEYKESADSLAKKFQPGSSLIKFLRSRPTLFELALVGKEYQVKLHIDGQ